MSAFIDTPGTKEAAQEQWFAGDRRLFCIAGPLDQDGQDNPERVGVGHAVHVPRSVCLSLGVDPELTFTVVEIRRFAFGAMGFCEVDRQPGRGAWIRLCHLARSEWHTRLERARPAGLR